MTSPYAPTVSYGSIVERLRRAFGLVGDVPIAPKPDLTNVINVADLTTPGHATYRGRRFLHYFTQIAAAANSYIGFRAADTIVIDSVTIGCATAASAMNWWILPAALADGAGWAWTTSVGFSERVLSVNDYAPVQRMTLWVAAPPAVPGLSIGQSSYANSIAAMNEFLRTPVVLQAGDRLMMSNVAAGPTVTCGMSGYVF